MQVSCFYCFISLTLRPLQINSDLCFPSTARIWLLSALKLPLFRILPLFSGYSCILTGSVKAISKRYQQCCQVGSHFTLVLFLQLKKEGSSLSMLLCSFLWLYQANNGLKSCQSYNEIMEMDRPPACKYA